MSKEFTAIMPDGTERFAASMANDRALLFFDIAKLLESRAGVSCGIDDDQGEDEYRVAPDRFIAFFERLHAAGWITEQQGFVYGWASHAAGMIENITLTPRVWLCRDGSELKVSRYIRDDELSSRIKRT